jgi:hypothetical protein
MDALGRNFEETKEGFAVAGWRGWLLLALFMLYPVAVQTVLHPSDAVGFQYWLQGEPVPHLFTTHMLVAGELAALFSLIGLSLAVFVVTLLFYRKAGYWFRLWPLVGITVGGFGNLGWWFYTGHFDPFGALAGLAPLSLSVVIFAICDHLGRDFVMGTKPMRAGA